MKFSNFNCLTLSATLLAVGAFCPNLHAADWGSLHGNNRSPGAPPQAASQRSQPQPAVRAPAQVATPRQQPQTRALQPAVRGPEPRQEVQPAREQPHVVDRVQPRPVAVDRAREQSQAVDRTRAGEMDRRRMDIDEERRQSYFWSDFHAGMRIDRLPDGYRRFDVRGRHFFYFGGVYYDDGPSGYVVCAPPLDADIPDLPPGTETIQVGNTVYYYAAGAFYVQQPDGSFVVVAAPLGVTVALLPPDATSVVVNGTGYFQADGTFYLPVMQNGVTAYLTVPQP
ncbi:MAG TPA: DUF6515 family protein [Candidatus Limnocylindrales bacterium]|nr:DUF6515 family protein [Candidatus Limnocylindrales bacterium]